MAQMLEGLLGHDGLGGRWGHTLHFRDDESANGAVANRGRLFRGARPWKLKI